MYAIYGDQLGWLTRGQLIGSPMAVPLVASTGQGAPNESVSVPRFRGSQAPRNSWMPMAHGFSSVLEPRVESLEFWSLGLEVQRLEHVASPNASASSQAVEEHGRTSQNSPPPHHPDGCLLLGPAGERPKKRRVGAGSTFLELRVNVGDPSNKK